MAFEMLIGVYVTDEVNYQLYRNGMSPLLDKCGGGIGYDFQIAEVLRSKTDLPINRVFTIYFPDADTKNQFFSNEDYLKLRTTYFEKSGTAIVLASYEL